VPVVIPVGFSQLTLRWALSGSSQTAEVVFGLNFADPADVQQVADSIPFNLNQVVSSSYTYVHAQARVADGAIFEKIYTDVGGGPAAQTPPNTCFLLRKVTSLPGRKNKGRMYLPGPSETSVDHTGLLTTTLVNSVNTQANNLLTAIAGAPPGGFGVMVILHNEFAPQPAPTNVDQLVCQQLVATQRRRLRG
jgi:hypothetical protein